MFKVEWVGAFSLHSSAVHDGQMFDYSILRLDRKNDEDDAFLDELKGLHCNLSSFVQGSTALRQDATGNVSLPLFMFSHPRGVAKRLSVGTYPTEGIQNDPIPHIVHDVPTLAGCSASSVVHCTAGKKPDSAPSSGFFALPQGTRRLLGTPF